VYKTKIMIQLLSILFWLFALVGSTLALLSRISDKGIMKANKLDWAQLIFTLLFIGILIGVYLTSGYG